MSPAEKKRYEKLIQQGRDLMNEASEMKDKEDRDKSAALVGKYFKVKSNYSEPKGPKDYWWIYSKILGVGEFGSWVRVFSFHTCAQGTTTIKPDYEERDNFMTYGSEHKEIKAKEFIAAWHKLLGNMHAMGLE